MKLDLGPKWICVVEGDMRYVVKSGDEVAMKNAYLVIHTFTYPNPPRYDVYPHGQLDRDRSFTSMQQAHEHLLACSSASPFIPEGVDDIYYKQMLLRIVHAWSDPSFGNIVGLINEAAEALGVKR